jgi:hypothetical protein
MVDPRERLRDGANSLRHQQRQGLFQRHSMISVKGSARGEGVATPLASSARMRACFHIPEKKSRCAKSTDFKSHWNWKNTRNRTLAAPGKNNLRRTFNQRKYKTTVMRTCSGK